MVGREGDSLLFQVRGKKHHYKCTWRKGKWIFIFFIKHVIFLFCFPSVLLNLPQLMYLPLPQFCSSKGPSVHCGMKGKSHKGPFFGHVISSLPLGLHCICALSAGLWLSSLLENPHVQGCRGREDRICVSPVIHCHVEKVSMRAVTLGLGKELSGPHDMLYKSHLFTHLLIFPLSFVSTSKIQWLTVYYAHTQILSLSLYLTSLISKTDLQKYFFNKYLVVLSFTC